MTALAQNIEGRLADEAGEPLPYANIVLQTTDSVFVSGATSDEKGGFRLARVQAGNYRLVVSCIGYRTRCLDLLGFERSADMGVLTLTEDAKLLGEVVVTAGSLSGTADKKVAFPTEKQVKASANGVDLLRTMMLPRLNVNLIDGSVGTTDGGTVQFCINGRPATQQEVATLTPAEILRVELDENPGLRFGESAMVVDYIVRRYRMGGTLSYDGAQSLKSGFGNHNAAGRMNFGRSEVSFFYGNRLQYFNDIWLDKTETFNFGDGSSLHRHQHTETNGQHRISQWGGLTYNLQEEGKYMLNVSAKLDHQLQPTLREFGKLYTEEQPDQATDRKEALRLRNLTPSLDVYYQHHLKNKQFLALNAVGTYIATKNRSSYAEYLDEEAVVDYTSGVRGKKYSLIAEGIYEKNFSAGRLSIGVKHTQGYADNEYRGTLAYHTQMRQANTYAYAQWRGRWKTVNYGLGLGVTRTWLHQEGEETYETWTPNPRLNLSLPLGKQWSASLQGSATTVNPSLSQLSAVDQLTDSLQLQRGNPSLESYTRYDFGLRLNYNHSKWNVGLYSYYNLYDNVISKHIYREGRRFVHSYANHPGYDHLYSGINVRVSMLWNVLTLSGGLHSDWNRSRGLDYRHTHHSIGWNINALLMYKNFTAIAMYQKDSDHFRGEYLSTGEETHGIELRYRLRSLNIGLRMFNPFQSDYARREENINSFAGYRQEYHIDDIARMVCLTLSWNFSFGRDYKTHDRRMNNSDTDSGVM